MATQKIQLGVDISDNGSAAKTKKNVQDLHSEILATQKAAANVNVGGTQGSRAVAARAQPQGSQTMSGQEYGSARGTAGITGASARDFANQAQGLGGLVRLYATFAANIFAVSAAFTALKNAADTTNLVKGLDTLGATAGKSLGTLSKRLVEVTDGAISMREAMTATAQASSAGMSSKNIERLAVVAKNASLALGVSMPDALSRLSRGIVKLEPELLDELGIFTKIGPATEKYALEIGKTASSLTDFERRQAFANAVLAEGEKKFGALADAAANPYDKLLASLKNVLQSGLELINKVLTPVISLLAQSPVALSAILAGIGLVLLKQAIPAVGQLREGLKRTAEETLKTAEAFKESFGDEFQARLEQRFKIPDLQSQVKKAEADLAKLKTPKTIASVEKLASGDDISAANIARVNKRLASRNDIVESGMKSGKKASDALIAAAKAEAEYITRVIALYKQKQALIAAQAGAQEVADITPGRLDPETLALKKYQDLRSKVDRQNAISNAAQNAQIMGISGSWALLNKEIADKGITGISKYSTLAQGGVAAVTSRVLGLSSVFAELAQVVGIAIGAFALLDSLFSKNAKETERFTAALKTSEEAVANVSRTLAAATNIQGIPTRTIDTTIALSNAFNELTDSSKEAIKTANAASAAASSWDKFWNGVFSLVGRDRSSKLADTIAEQIKSSISILSREGLADEYSKEIKKILNVENLEDINTVSAAWKKLSQEQKTAVQSIQDNANRALGNASSALKSFKDTTEEGLKAYKTFINSFIDTSPLFKLGEAYINIGKSLTEVIVAGPDRVGQAFDELATNTDKAALFGREFVDSFAQVADRFKKQRQVIEDTNEGIKRQIDLVNTLAKSQQNLAETQSIEAATAAAVAAAPVLAGSGGTAPRRATREELELAQADLRQFQRAAAQLPRDAINAGIDLLVQAREKVIDKGIALVDRAIRQAEQAAKITLGRAIAASFTGPQKLLAESSLRKQEIQAQLDNLQLSESLLDIQSALVDELRLANALQAEANILAKTGVTEQEKTAARNQVTSARLQMGDTSAIPEGPNRERAVALVQQDVTKNQELRKKGLQAQRIALRGELDALSFTTQQKLPIEQRAQQEELNKIIDRRLATERSILDITNSIAGVTSIQLIKDKQAEDQRKLEFIQQREISSIQDKITEAENARARAQKEGNKELERQAQAQIDQLGKVKAETERAQKAEANLTTARNRQELLNQELDQLSKRYDLTVAQRELENSIATSNLEYRAQELQLYGSVYGMSQNVLISRQAELDRQKTQLETTIAIANIENELQRKRAEADIRTAALGGRNTTDQTALRQIEAIDAQVAREAELAGITTTRLLQQRDARLTILELTEKLNKEQERYNVLLSTSASITDSLKNIFGEVGTAVGNFASSLTEVGVQNEKNAKLLAENAQRQKEVNAAIAADPEGDNRAKLAKEAFDLRQQESELNKKAFKDELSGNIKVLASAKTLFKEKTTAYKVLSGMEKAMHIAKLAMEAKELFVRLSTLATTTAATAGAEAAQTGTTFAGTLSRLGAYAAEIYGKTIGQLGPIAGPAIAAALVAAMFSMFGKGGGSSAPAFVMGAEQRQETQGTGTAYDAQGNKFETGGGVFGDATAKLDSINKSMEVLKDNSIDGLFYDNRMLNALERIAKSITGAAEAIYSTPGIRSGLNFGTLPGSNQSGGFLAAINSIPIVGSISKALFGGGTSSTSSITDSGIQLRGTLQDIVDAVGSSVMQYKEILTQFTKSGGLFSSSRSWSTLTREVNGVSAEILESFSEIFKESKALFIGVAGIAGIAASEVDKVFAETTTGLDISLLGLKGEDVVKELNASISAQLDVVSRQLFSSFDKFRDFGEGYTDTVIRVVSTNDKVTVALKAMGIAADNISGKFNISESIVSDMALSLENFTEQAKFFIDNFLTEAERINVTRAGVNAALADLALPATLTRTEFRNLVQSLDLTTVAGRNMYQSLQDIAPEFIKVTERLEDLKTESGRLSIDLLRAQGNTQAADGAVRALAIEGMTQAELAAYDYNESLRKQIEALKEADTITKQRATLEQKLYQVSGNIVALRAAELNALYESNRALQLQVWAFEDFTKSLNNAKTAITAANQAIETAQNTITSLQNTATDNYIAATQKVADAQQNIANLAVEAAKRMRDFGVSIREFVRQQIMPGGTQGINFVETISRALSGDTESIGNVTAAAQQAIDSARATAASAAEFAQARAGILSEVIRVAQFAESEAAKTQIPVTEDPLIAANRALQLALEEQARALATATTLGASLVKVPEDLAAKYVQANLDLATALADKLFAEQAQQKAQSALDAIAFNTGRMITVLTTANTQTVDLVNSIRTGFGALDVNLSNGLTFEELKQGLAGKASDQEIKKLIDVIDFNLDTVVTSYELELFSTTKLVVDALNSGFSLLDTNLDSKLSIQEFKAGMSDKASDSVLEGIFRLIDANNSSLLEFTESTAAKSTLLAAETGTPQKFAQGGVFTNRVVTGATRFQFGEMAESGPEAIMPLARTSNGNLGVVAQPLPQNNLSDALVNQNAALVAEVRALRDEVNLLRFEARATASATNKTTRILERVTRDGETLLVTDSATL